MPTTRRLEGLDAARGLAVISMLVAQLSPAGGVFTISEYLTAPLFAVVIGIAMGIHLADRRPGAGQSLLETRRRGGLLILLACCSRRCTPRSSSSCPTSACSSSS